MSATRMEFSTSTLPISLRLCRLIQTKNIDSTDLDAAALFLLDTIAAGFAGTRTAQGRKFLSWMKNCRTMPDCGRIAMLWGALCHILETDDLHRRSLVHPGCAVVPAVIALGGGMPGKKALTALLFGYEAATRVGIAAGPEHYRFWHNTATFGPFGSAMAASCLLDLSENQIVDALGNAGTQSAGLWEFLETGAESKHLHAGRAAEAGVVAAELASLGLSGAPRILEGERGLIAATCPGGNASIALEREADPWQIHETSIKPWPSCRHTHAAIDLGCRAHAEIDWRSITSVTVTSYKDALALCDRVEPHTAYEAKFSLQHTVAAALADGEVTFESFEAAALDRLRRLAARVHLTSGEPFQSAYPAQWGAKLMIAAEKGEQRIFETRVTRGDPEAKISRDDLLRKVCMLLNFARYPSADRLIDSILAMPNGGEMPDLRGSILLSD